MFNEVRILVWRVPHHARCVRIFVRLVAFVCVVAVIFVHRIDCVRISVRRGVCLLPDFLFVGGTK